MKLTDALRALAPGRRDINGSDVSGLENPNIDIVTALVAHQDGTTASGISVTPLKAFRLAAVYACVKVIAESLASLPVDISKKDSSGEGREIVFDDPRLNLLNDFPNPEMTGMELFENWVAHALLWGKGYLYIQKNKAGKAIELWPLPPDKTVEKRTTSGQLYYVTEVNGKTEPIPAENVIPLRCILGQSPVMNARDVIAGAAAAEQYAGRFWSNNGRPGGVIQVPETMEDDELDEFRRRWAAGHEGLKRAQLVGILTGGAKWQEVGIAPGAAQFIETRQFSVREICRLFGVPPHRIGDLEGTINRGSLEQQSIEFVTYTLRGWVVRSEQALRSKLFNGKDDLAADKKPMFNVNALMRGDMRARYAAHAVGVQWGFVSRAEVRRQEGLATVDDEHQLEEFLVPLNMIPSKKLDEIDVGGVTKGGSGGGGALEKPSGGTEPTTGSDGSTVQQNSLRALMEYLEAHDPDLAERLANFAIEQATRQAIQAPKPFELPAGDTIDDATIVDGLLGD